MKPIYTFRDATLDWDQIILVWEWLGELSPPWIVTTASIDTINLYL